MQMLENVSLKPYNTFGIDVKADRMLFLRSAEDVDVFIENRDAYRPFLILGSGANILFTKDFHGTVVRMETKGIRELFRENGRVYVEAEAGECWDDFVRYCVKQQFYGVENLALIPSQVGSAAVQNIGAYGREVKDVVHEVHAVCLETGEEKHFSRDECRFAYRSSLFKSNPGKYLVRSVVFALSLEPHFHTDYGDVAERLRQRGKPSLQAVYDVISGIRREKLPDVKVLGSAGSFFKNPVVSAEKWVQLHAAYPQLKSFPETGGRVKLSAAQLIDSLGWKGKRIGDAGVHERQALVLVNHGKATGSEILRLSQRIQTAVAETYGVDLEAEVILC